MNQNVLKWAGLGVAGAAVVFSVVLASRFGSDPSLVESPLIGTAAPMLELPMLDGSGSFDFSETEGRITVINFFASWCPECRNEHADLIATADAFAGSNIQFVQISYQEAPEFTLSYLAVAGKSDSTIYLHDPGSRAAIAYGVFGIPETFFIDEAGVVVGKIIGEADALILGGTLDAIIAGETPGQQNAGDTRQRPEG